MSDNESDSKNGDSAPAPTSPSSGELHHHVIPTERCGAVNVWVQGDLALAHNEGKDSHPVFLTVHDVGTNHKSWLQFVNHPAMHSIKERAIFVHVDILGQENGAENLTNDQTFPTLQHMGEDLVNILDVLQIKCVIGMGEGAGANIILRFGMMHVTRCLGIICINPTATSSGMMENLKEKFNVLKIGRSKSIDERAAVACAAAAAASGQADVGSPESRRINPKNIHKYVEAFANREDITTNLERHLTCDTLLVSCSKDAAVKNMDHVFQACDKTKTSKIKIDDCGDVLEEAPAKLANSVLLFVKGLGWLTSVNLPNVERRSSRDRRMSMEEYDRPNIRRLSLTGASPAE